MINKKYMFGCSMNLRIILITPLLVSLSITLAFAEITGEIIALDGNQVQVRIDRSNRTRAQSGDSALFKADLGGIEVDAGIGTVLSHKSQTIVIQVTEGNPGLGMTAFIEATGGKKLEDEPAKRAQPSNPNTGLTVETSRPAPVDSRTPEEQWRAFLNLLAQNENEAIDLLKDSARRGYVQAQRDLAEYYRLGMHGLTENKKEALRWHLAAAKQDDEQSIHQVGSLLYWGEPDTGLEPDPVSALPWLHKAAEAGNSAAMYVLGHAYSESYLSGISFNYTTAVEWYKKAIDAGNKHAVEQLDILSNRKVEYKGIKYLLPKELRNHPRGVKGNVYSFKKGHYNDPRMANIKFFPLIQVHTKSENKRPSSDIFLEHAKRAAKYPFGLGKRKGFTLFSEPGAIVNGMDYAAYSFKRSHYAGRVYLLYDTQSNQMISVLALAFNQEQFIFPELSASEIVLTMWR